MSRTNYIFIDYENVQETDLDRIAGKPVKVVLVVGAHHKSLPLALVQKLLEYPGQVTLVTSSRCGKNALDLVLAQHIGEAKKGDPYGYFHILSRDKDFDALIGHLKDNDTLAARRAAFNEIPVLMNNAERVESIIARFKPKEFPRAGKRNRLESQIQSLFGKALSPEELEDTIKGLVAAKAFEITNAGAVAYNI